MNLRKPTPDDFSEIRHWVPDARSLLQWAGPKLSFPLTVEQFTALLNDIHINAFTYELDGIVLGYGEIVVPSEHQGMVCRVIISDTARGNGLGKNLIQQLVDAAFDELLLDKLTLNVFDFNHSAINCYESVGFQAVKRITDAREFEDEKWNILVMELVNPNSAQ